MRYLYHHELSPASRTVRIVLAEKGVPFGLRVEETWRRNEAFLALNPAGEVPVLLEPDGFPVCGGWAICEYLEELYPSPGLLGADPRARAEVRRLVEWFDTKFFREVTEPVVREKIFSRMYGSGSPDSREIRAANANLREHLKYIRHLYDRRSWLAGDVMTLADLAAAAHLSLVDYAGDVPWSEFRETKEWYAILKSRPSFRPLLEASIPAVRPPPHYADLDF
ncbi:glutathione S-transferase family protein [Phaeovibrio sulfidiphilus]|uniref:Glutathione S-transferase family protein n=1 Tax=Phaeovibrio sulfidiphilus TaxID=1220600 RepID=A0A8J6YWV5_9PROT|nr:glutathione S-transferase family protein [Phaeovibrio sulfidiphilus]MBE1236158.1 glutathione S-transferase family protein [Phaeovibrio sulfidiphilus]